MAGDEQPRAQSPGQTLGLTREESWQLLGSVSLGRIVFTQHAMTAIRPVSHLIDDETIIIRSHLGPEITGRAATGDGTVVCYEADEINPVRRTGWSVIATGTARLVRDPAVIARYEQILKPWAAGQEDYVIAVKPEMITGIRLAD